MVVVIIQLVLVALWLGGVIDWPWVLVLAPTLAFLAAYLVLLALVVIVELRDALAAFVRDYIVRR